MSHFYLTMFVCFISLSIFYSLTLLLSESIPSLTLSYRYLFSFTHPMTLLNMDFCLSSYHFVKIRFNVDFYMNLKITWLRFRLSIFWSYIPLILTREIVITREIAIMHEIVRTMLLNSHFFNTILS